MTEKAKARKYQKCANIVDAVYSEPVEPSDIGNIFIEALPAPLTKEDIGRKYYRILNFTPARGKENRILQKSQIRQFSSIFRLPLPYHEKLEEDFRDSVIRAYRERTNAMRKSNREVVVEDEQIEQSMTFRQVIGADIENGISLLGESASGKSCSMEMVLSGYPQVIRHTTEDGRVTQILYICVTTEVNSDMKALYDSMARAIDEALANDNCIYSRQCEKLVSVSKKAGYIKELIKLFNIGAIVLDEIQNFTINSVAENSFKSIIKLTNETKTALISIGTEESFERLYDRPYMIRRAGRVIDVSEFCENDPERCRHNAEWIMRNQWFDEQVPVTKEMIDFICVATCNVIGLMVHLWTSINIEYIESEVRPEVNIDFFRKVTLEKNAVLLSKSYEARRLNPMRNINFTIEGWPLLNKLKDTESSAQPNATSALENLVLCSPQNMKKHGFINPDLASAVIKRVMNNLDENNLKYNYETIVEVMLKIEGKNGASFDELEFVKKALSAIKQKPTDGRRGKGKGKAMAESINLSSLAANL